MKRRNFLKMCVSAVLTPTVVARAVMNNPVDFTGEYSIALNHREEIGRWLKEVIDEDIVVALAGL